jgi:putative aldouronate transport system permease protein
MSVELLGAGRQRAGQTRGTEAFPAPSTTPTDVATVRRERSSRRGSRDAPLKSPGRPRRTRIRRHAQLYVIIALPFAFLVIFNYWPMLGAQIAFRNYNPVQGMWGSPWIGLSEFRQFAQSPYFSVVIRNTLTLSIYSLIVGTPASLILALAINEVKHARFKRIAQMVTYAPYFISTVVLIGMIDLILAPQGSLLAQTLHLFGIHQVPDLLGSPGDFPSLYIWSGVWQTSGYSAVIYLAALSAVNPELYEAARLDGASRPQKIRYVDFPTILPTVIIVLVLSVGGILSVGFEKAYLMQNPLNLSSSEIISTYVYKTGLLSGDFSFATAVGIFNSVVGFVLLLITNFVARFVSGVSLF